jgi:hypothetical protein
MYVSYIFGIYIFGIYIFGIYIFGIYIYIYIYMWINFQLFSLFREQSRRLNASTSFDDNTKSQN